MKYFSIIIACIMLDIIEPTGCSRHSDEPLPDQNIEYSNPAATPAPAVAE